MQNACEAWDITSARLRVDVWKRVEAESCASYATQEFHGNDTSMMFICRYLTTLHEVMGRSKTASEQPSARELQQPLREAICSFVSLQKELITMPLTFTSSISTEIYSLAERLMELDKKQAEQVFTKLLNKYIVELQCVVDIGGVPVCAVHEEIMEKGEPASLLELIVSKACVARILADCMLLFDAMPTTPRDAEMS